MMPPEDTLPHAATQPPAAANAAVSPGRVLEIREPAALSTPFVFASPHSGRDYSAAFLAASRLDALTLRRSEDCFVDELFDAAPAHGAPLLLAHFPRAFCDVNRDPAELDPAMYAEPVPRTPQTRSARVSAGLGVIARIVRDGAEIYPHPLKLAEAEWRLAQYHEPYHAQLEALIARSRTAFRRCLLIDCHSMPSAAVQPAAHQRSGPPDIVLGDRYGASCNPALTAFAEAALSAEGFKVARNNPYAGGFTIERYGVPQKGVHALQIEINRGLYLDEDRLEKKDAAFESLKARLTRVIAALVKFRLP